MHLIRFLMASVAICGGYAMVLPNEGNIRSTLEARHHVEAQDDPMPDVVSI